MRQRIIYSLLAITPIALARADERPVIQIEDTSGSVIQTLDDVGLLALPQMDLTTATPWSPNGKEIHFRGPTLRRVLEDAKLGTGDVEIEASDNFVAKISRQDIDAFDPIIALDEVCDQKVDANRDCNTGVRPLNVDDGGPYYLVWPRKRLPPHYEPERNFMWVWFVTTIRAIRP